MNMIGKGLLSGGKTPPDGVGRMRTGRKNPGEGGLFASAGFMDMLAPKNTPLKSGPGNSILTGEQTLMSGPQTAVEGKPVIRKETGIENGTVTIDSLLKEIDVSLESGVAPAEMLAKLDEMNMVPVEDRDLVNMDVRRPVLPESIETVSEGIVRGTGLQKAGPRPIEARNFEVPTYGMEDVSGGRLDDLILQAGITKEPGVDEHKGFSAVDQGLSGTPRFETDDTRTMTVSDRNTSIKDTGGADSVDLRSFEHSSLHTGTSLDPAGPDQAAPFLHSLLDSDKTAGGSEGKERKNPRIIKRSERSIQADSTQDGKTSGLEGNTEFKMELESISRESGSGNTGSGSVDISDTRSAGETETLIQSSGAASSVTGSGRSASAGGLDQNSSVRVIETATRGLSVQLGNVIARTSGDEISMKLFPPDLGEMRIRVSVDGKKVKASFIVESVAVKQAIHSGTGQLADAVMGEGFVLENLDVSVSDSGQHAEWNGSEENVQISAETKQRDDARQATRPAVPHMSGRINILV